MWRTTRRRTVSDSLPVHTAPAAPPLHAMLTFARAWETNARPVLSATASGAATTLKVKLCDAFGGTPFDAVIVTGYTPPLAPEGVPASVAVPSPLSVKLTPAGSGPDSDNDGAGTPVVATVNVPEMPVVNVAWLALVIDGAVGVG